LTRSISIQCVLDPYSNVVPVMITKGLSFYAVKLRSSEQRSVHRECDDIPCLVRTGSLNVLDAGLSLG
jgi:hypothetical protein